MASICRRAWRGAGISHVARDRHSDATEGPRALGEDLLSTDGDATG